MNQSKLSGAMPSDTASSAMQIDILEIVRRYYLLILLCSIIACALGAAYCCVADKSYKSSAQVLIQKTQTPFFNEQSQQDRSSLRIENDLDTHRLVLESALILDRAVSEGKLSQLADFRGLSESSLKELWEEHLVVAIPDDDASVLSVNYVGTSPGDCQKIVASIVDVYASHLGESSAKLGKEVTALIKRGKDDLLQQIQRQEADYAEFQRTSPLLWREGEGVNLFQERQSEIEGKRKELLVEKSMLDAKLAGTIESLRAGGDEVKAVFFEAMLELKGADEQEDLVEREASRGYGLELSREYMELLSRESELDTEYGDGYPELIAIRAKIRKMRAAVESSIGRKLGSDGMAISREVMERTGSQAEFVSVYVRMLQARSKALQLQLASLNREFEQATRAGEKLQQYTATDRSMRADQERTKLMFDAVVSRLEEINIIQDYGGETMRVLASPSLGEVVWPSIPIVMSLSLLLGAMTGMGWALLRSLTVHVFKSPAEIRELLQAPVLGQIPDNRPQKSKVAGGIDSMIGAVHDSTSRYSEAFRGVRTAVHFGACNSGKTVLQVTSSSPGDGKSTVATNLAVVFAQTGKRVVLIDADMRRPTIHKLMNLDRGEGLSDFLSDRIAWLDIIQPSEISNLSIITAGSPTDRPAELLTLESLDELIGQLRASYDVVIFDSPPLLAVSDPSIIAPRVDGVLLVVRIREKVRVASQRACGILSEVGAVLLGAIVNGLSDKQRGYGSDYQSGYSYGYGYKEAGSYYGLDENSSSKVPKNGKSIPKSNGARAKRVDSEYEASSGARAELARFTKPV